MKSCKNLKGGLQEVANELEVTRVGPQHQAGSDSLLTGQTFFRMKEMFFEDDIDDSKYLGHLYGLGTNHVVAAPPSSTPVSTAAAAAAVAAATGDLTDTTETEKEPPTTADDAATSSSQNGDVPDPTTSKNGSGSGEESNTSGGNPSQSSQDSNFAPLVGGVSSLLISGSEDNS